MTRLGLIVPPANTTNEAEWQRMLPPDTSLHLVRMPLHADTESEAGKRALYADLRKAIVALCAHECDVIAYGCTAGSMVLPLDRLTTQMQAEAGVPCVATAPALVHACRALGLKKIALATPYDDAVNQHETEFFAASGIEVVSLKGLGFGLGKPQEFAKVAKLPKQQAYEHCRSTDVPAAEGMVVSCTDFPSLEAIARLEAELGKPVVSSNTATLWAALRAAGVQEPLAGFGKLLESSTTDSSI